MKYSFNASKGSIVVQARVTGVRGRELLTLILDTGAEITAINPLLLSSIGL